MHILCLKFSYHRIFLFLCMILSCVDDLDGGWVVVYRLRGEWWCTKKETDIANKENGLCENATISLGYIQINGPIDILFLFQCLDYEFYFLYAFISIVPVDDTIISINWWVFICSAEHTEIYWGIYISYFFVCLLRKK